MHYVIAASKVPSDMILVAHKQFGRDVLRLQLSRRSEQVDPDK
jgi:hypothetical protein